MKDKDRYKELRKVDSKGWNHLYRSEKKNSDSTPLRGGGFSPIDAANYTARCGGLDALL